MSRGSVATAETKTEPVETTAVVRQFSFWDVLAGIASSGSNAYYLYVLAHYFLRTAIALGLTIPPGVIVGVGQIYYTLKKNKQSTVTAKHSLEKNHAAYWKAYNEYKVAYGACKKVASQQMQVQNRKAHELIALIIECFEKQSSSSVSIPKSESQFILPSSSIHITINDPALTGVTSLEAPVPLDEDLSRRLFQKKSLAVVTNSEDSKWYGLYKIRSGIKDVPKLIIFSYMPEITFYATFFLQQVGADFTIALSISGVLSIFAAPILAYVINRPSGKKLADLDNKATIFAEKAEEYDDKRTALEDLESKFDSLAPDFKAIVIKIKDTAPELLKDLIKSLKESQVFEKTKREKAGCRRNSTSEAAPDPTVGTTEHKRSEVSDQKGREKRTRELEIKVGSNSGASSNQPSTAVTKRQQPPQPVELTNFSQRLLADNPRARLLTRSSINSNTSEKSTCGIL